MSALSAMVSVGVRRKEALTSTLRKRRMNFPLDLTILPGGQTIPRQA
jgi:hypothetical protein